MSQKLTIPQSLDLAIREAKSGRLTRAENIVGSVLAAVPNHPGALQLGAQIKELRKTAQPNPKLWMPIARKIEAGELEEAEQELIELQKKFPGGFAVYVLRGDICLTGRLYEPAFGFYLQATKIRPADPEGHFKLGLALFRWGREPEAVQAFANADRLKPGDREARLWLARALDRAERTPEALELLDALIAEHPKRGELHAHRGDMLITTGRIDEGRDSLMRAIELNPKAGFAYAALARSRKVKEGDAVIELATKAAEAMAGDGEDNQSVAFALGKIHEDLGNAEEAARWYKRGNDLQRENLAFDVSAALNDFGRMAQDFDAKFLAGLPAPTGKPDLPIFVVGMPRSGTTLVEQIISSHPEVAGAGEQRFVSRQFVRFIRTYGAAESFADIPDLQQKCAETGDMIREALREVGGGAARVTDKMPANFQYIGFIRAVLPDAKIVHCVRDARDNVLSIYKNNFAAPGMGYSNDMGDLAAYRNAYNQLMQHWKSVLPDHVYDIEYAKLTANPEAEARALIAHLGLEWDDACLEFYKSKRAIRTASVTQARQPIYQSSVEAWRKFEEPLAPLFGALDH
ncbi:tetratricopeptide repeat-containing sulfotransferase family protein [Oceanomicrobium pacificus]|uniref:Tetratricopeptide repeat protein n=1 Tax=Oceanomicrobium pacificus TaxID=2692916 RepID=A0A6B0U4X5_9RHOB|nr:tetratricopeptide repeat-containing sulfotransferase family protein [Oceanomicrobium pacificus]MXU65981.1 tetratricopeptide repeat protein [Oceanomicrobium pacificus]